MKYFILIFSLAMTPIFARASSESQNPCAVDYQKFCGKVDHKKEGYSKCAREHRDEFSSECKAQMEENKTKGMERIKKHVALVKEKCPSDIEKFCKDTTSEKRGMSMCLRDHEAELSSDCKAVLFPQR